MHKNDFYLLKEQVTKIGFWQKKKKIQKQKKSKKNNNTHLLIMRD